MISIISLSISVVSLLTSLCALCRAIKLQYVVNSYCKRILNTLYGKSVSESMKTEYHNK